MNRDKVKFGLVGAGRIAQSYAQAFEVTSEADIVAVCDNRSEAAEAFAAPLGSASYGTVEEMSDKESLDAVLVCSPPVTHRDICMHFLEQKIPVLCEKPLSLDSASAHEMHLAADQAGVKFTMASKFRYVEDVVRAKGIVTSGILGDIVLFENAFTSRVDMKGRWNSNPKISGGGVLIDNGTHSVDLMRYFLGPISAVQVIEGKRSQDLDVEETVRIFLRSVDNVIGNVDLSWSINKELDRYISIYGTHGTVLIGWRESKFRQSSSDEWVVFGKGYDKVQAFRGQIDNFVGAIRGDEVLRISADEAVASVGVVEAAYQSLTNSHWTDVEPAYEVHQLGFKQAGIAG